MTTLDSVGSVTTITEEQLSTKTMLAWADHPRPQLVRPCWVSLDGLWDFTSMTECDDRDPSAITYDGTITVPYPPESPASGAEIAAGHSVLWYRRRVSDDELRRAGFGTQGDRVFARFGAVDHRADVWFDGQHVASHEGGQTPFSAALPLVHDLGGIQVHELVVRVEDDPVDVEQPRGKQDWREAPHSIWYGRTSGIWQTVWLEAVPQSHFGSIVWTPDVPAAEVVLEGRLSRTPGTDVEVTVRLEWQGELLAEQRMRVLDRSVRMKIGIARQVNGQQYEDLLWSPENPRLIDAVVTVHAAGDTVDHITSYLGLRSATVDRGRFLLNDRPYYVRAVLDQGYRQDTHLAVPGADSLREEVLLIKSMGFNAARMHQKVEDPRFLAWADRLGLLIWGETANAYAFSPRAVRLLTAEWLDIIERDRSHPCIVTWVVFNESWGVQHGAHDKAQRDYVTGLTALTRAIDPGRPVISNDGWEHGDSDILTIHDYSPTGDELRRNYDTADAVRALIEGMGPAGRRLSLESVAVPAKPIMITEFGGVAYANDGMPESWGYSSATDAAEYEGRLRDLFDALRESETVSGFCFTQLADTGTETNGLIDLARNPKLPIAVIRNIVLGGDESQGERTDGEVDA